MNEGIIKKKHYSYLNDNDIYDREIDSQFYYYDNNLPIINFHKNKKENTIINKDNYFDHNKKISTLLYLKYTDIDVNLFISIFNNDILKEYEEIVITTLNNHKEKFNVFILLNSIILYKQSILIKNMTKKNIYIINISKIAKIIFDIFKNVYSIFCLINHKNNKNSSLELREYEDILKSSFISIFYLDDLNNLNEYMDMITFLYLYKYKNWSGYEFKYFYIFINSRFDIFKKIDPYINKNKYLLQQIEYSNHIETYFNTIYINNIRECYE